MQSAQDRLAINTIRILSAEMVETAQSGHPGLPMGAAAIAYVLWGKILRFHPREPRWPNRDRFVLSAGHGSALLYSMLHLTGYDLSLDQLKRFRQWGSPCAGHPEFGETPGVETTTGPLGQGLGVSVGMAIAQAHLAALFNREAFPLFDHHIYCLAGDGCMMEGISHEAASLAGHLGLNRLIVLYDSNRISIDGSTDLAFTEDVAKRFQAYHWQVEEVDGLDLEAIEKALLRARQEKERPSLIICKTHIGYGSPHKMDTAEAHGAPLGEKELELTKEKLGWTERERFSIPESVREEMGNFSKAGVSAFTAWQRLFTDYEKQFPREADLLKAGWKGGDLNRMISAWPVYSDQEGSIATRSVSGKILQTLTRELPLLWGGSADLSESNSTLIKDGGDFARDLPSGKNLRFGVREHAMGAILNGLAHSDLILPYGGTFLVFSDYMRPSIRLAALMGLSVVYVFTHESIFLGEDGPTHQPIEHLASLRAIPNVRVIRPADAKETVAAWRFVLAQRHLGPHGQPIALCLTRQKVPVLAGTKDTLEGLGRGGYVVRTEEGDLSLILIASGSEVEICCQAAKVLEKSGKGVRVVSMPCREIFLQQEATYREQVLPKKGKRMVVEAAAPQGWESIVGHEGRILGITRFGASAPYPVLQDKFGFTPESIVREAQLFVTVA